MQLTQLTASNAIGKTAPAENSGGKAEKYETEKPGDKRLGVLAGGGIAGGGDRLAQRDPVSVATDSAPMAGGVVVPAPEVAEAPAEPKSNTRQTGDVYMKPNTRQPSDVYLNPNTRQIHVKPKSGNIDRALDYESQLWRFETYKDKNGRTIVKRVVRFATPRTGRNLGEVNSEIEEKLKRRPGKGRTAEARAEAKRNRLLAQSLAEQLRRTKTGGRRGGTKRRGRKRAPEDKPQPLGREVLSRVRDISQHETGPYVH